MEDMNKILRREAIQNLSIAGTTDGRTRLGYLRDAWKSARCGKMRHQTFMARAVSFGIEIDDVADVMRFTA